MRTALWLVLVVATLGVASYAAFELARAGSFAFWALIGVPYAVVAGISAWQLRRSGRLRSILRPVWGDFAAGLFSMLALFVAAYGVSRQLVPAGASAFSWTPGNYLARFYLQFGSPPAVHARSARVLGGLIALAFAEELVWRGFVTNLLDERFGVRVGWLYTVALYVLAQIPTMWSLRDPITGLNPTLPLAAIGGGLVWGALMRRHRRLVPGIISHALYLWCVVLLFRLWGPNV